MVIERIWPAQRRPLFARGHRHDLILTVINATLVVPLVTALTLAFLEVVRRGLPWIVLPRIGTLPRWGAIAVIVVAMDGCNWVVHLANHRVRMLWRFHELHHSQEDMSVLTVFRTHPLIHVSYLLALIPGIVLLANGALPITLLVIYGGMVAFAHSNTNLGFGPLGRVFVSPNFHRIHHKLDGPQDVNLGFALTIWDQLFHRAVFPDRGDDQDRHRVAGSAAERRTAGERPRHCSVFAAQLVAPFRPMHELPTPLPFEPRLVDRGETARTASRTPSAPPAVPAAEAAGRVVPGDGDGLDAGRVGRSWAVGGRGRYPDRGAPADFALLAARIALAWIFIYYGAGKLFGWFNGPGIHRTALYFSQTAHLHPGGFFAVLGGVIELGGGIALALGLGSGSPASRSSATWSWR